MELTVDSVIELKVKNWLEISKKLPELQQENPHRPVQQPRPMGARIGPARYALSAEPGIPKGRGIGENPTRWLTYHKM
jgi:hypothetical protein